MRLFNPSFKMLTNFNILTEKSLYNNFNGFIFRKGSQTYNKYNFNVAFIAHYIGNFLWAKKRKNQLQFVKFLWNRHWSDKLAKFCQKPKKIR